MAKHGFGGSKTSAKRIELAELRQKALALRKQGYTEGAIAEMLGHWKNAGGVHAALKKAISEIYIPEAEEMKRLDLDTLEDCTRECAKIAFGVSDGSGTIPFEARMKAIEIIIKIIQARARLCGYEAPQKIDVTLQAKPMTEWSDEELSAYLAERRLIAGVD